MKPSSGLRTALIKLTFNSEDFQVIERACKTGPTIASLPFKSPRVADFNNSPTRYPRRDIIGTEDVNPTAIEAKPISSGPSVRRRPALDKLANPFDENVPRHADSPERMIEPAVRRPHEVRTIASAMASSGSPTGKIRAQATGQGPNPSP